MGIIRFIFSCFLGIFVLIGKGFNICDKRMERLLSEKVWYPIKMVLPLILIGMILVSFFPRQKSIPIQLMQLPGTDLYVRYMPEEAVSFIKQNYPQTDKRLMIYTEFMIYSPDPPCSKEFIAAFKRLRNDPTYQNGYLITPLRTKFESAAYRPGGAEEKKALQDLDERLKGMDAFDALCDLAVCIVDLDGQWVFNWDGMNGAESARRMQEVFDTLKK